MKMILNSNEVGFELVSFRGKKRRRSQRGQVQNCLYEATSLNESAMVQYIRGTIYISQRAEFLENRTSSHERGS